MEAVVGLLLMLLGVSHGIETYCDGRQNRAQCYGALGGSVVVRLMNSASEIYRYEWKKNKEVKLSGKRNRIESDLKRTRFSFTPSDGTFRINNLNRDDSGEYTLDTFDSTGTKSEPRTLQLLIQAPVSSVVLVSECLSQVLMRVSCSSEGGDSPQYSWTLDGRSLTDAELLCGNNETNVIILNQDVSGRLVCSVRNHINSVSKETVISTCDHSLLIFGLEAAVFILSVIGIIVYFTWKKKKYKKRESSRATRPEENSANSVVMVEMISSASGL